MGNQIMSGKDETVRLFANPILEYFSHIHPATPLIVYTPMVAFVGFAEAVQHQTLWLIAPFLGGVALWTLAEYVIHRWAFHYVPTSTIGKRLHFLVHGIHHAYPRDSTRLVMPPLVSLPLAAAFYALFAVLLAPYNRMVWIGFIVGYLAYDCIHYATHHLPLKGRMGRFLKQHHMHHHFVEPHSAYGVSNPLWDRIFATLPQRQRRESARRRKLVQFLQRQSSNGTRNISTRQRRSGSRF